jgi:hypothetical protein
MLKKRSKVQQRLAKVVMGALLLSGALPGMVSPSVAHAEGTITLSGVVVPRTSYDTDPANSMTWSYYVYPIDPTVTTVKVTGGNFNEAEGGIVGAFTDNDPSGHAVIVTGGTIQGLVAGAIGGEPKKMTENSVTVSGDETLVGTVAGGFAYSNGYSYASDVLDNSVTIDGGLIKGGVFGGRVAQSGGSIYGILGDVTDNKVIINNGTFGSASATGAEVRSNPKAIAGGFTEKGNAIDNHVTINNGTFVSTIVDEGLMTVGISHSIYGGFSNEGSANDNTVTINGGTLKYNRIEEISTFPVQIYGGKGTEEASNNTVTINTSLDGLVLIYGGDTTTNGGVTTGTAANNNIVNILKPLYAMGLYGGLGEKSTGNTLNIAAKNVTTAVVSGFQNMNFYLPSDIAGNDTMLTVDWDEATDVQGVTFGVAALQGVNLQKGDTVNLLVGKNGLTTDDTLKTADSQELGKAEFLSANSLTTDDKYELSISKKDVNTIIATVDNVTEKKAPEEAVDDVKKSPVETRAGVVTLINAGADLLVGQGMANAAEAAAEERAGGNNSTAASRAGGFAPFAAVSIGKLRAESGSHVDTKGIGLNLGFAREIENKSGKLLVGPVVEYGHGSYDSYQDNGIKADGKSSYWGIGVIAKQTNNNGFYYEGSVRGGRTKSDYGSDNVKPGTHVSYDSNATYWAFHLGAGKLTDIGHSNTLDYYGKYFYSHTGSDSAFLNGANETANFDSVNSHRIRLGARITHALNEKNNIYGGLAWQYEFNGEARATYSVSGEAPSPSVKGSSGMMELGWQVKPGKGPMTIDFGVTGWVGKQRGVTANLQANWTF